MEKNLNKVQKPLLWAFLIISALMLVTALCYSTDYIYITPDSGSTSAAVYPTINGANNIIFYCSVVSIVLFAILCIAGNKYRKKYYISNLVVGSVCSVGSLIFTIVSIIKNIQCVLEIDKNMDAIVNETRFYNLDKNGNIIEDYVVNFRFSYFALVVGIIAAIIYGLTLAFTIVKYIYSNKEFTYQISNEKVGE